MDTALHTPHEICKWNTAGPVPGGTYRAGPRSALELIGGEEPMPRISTGVRSAPAQAIRNPRNLFRPDHSIGLLRKKVRHS